MSKIFTLLVGVIWGFQKLVVKLHCRDGCHKYIIIFLFAAIVRWWPCRVAISAVVLIFGVTLHSQETDFNWSTEIQSNFGVKLSSAKSHSGKYLISWVDQTTQNDVLRWRIFSEEGEMILEQSGLNPGGGSLSGVSTIISSVDNEGNHAFLWKTGLTKIFAQGFYKSGDAMGPPVVVSENAMLVGPVGFYLTSIGNAVFIFDSNYLQINPSARTVSLIDGELGTVVNLEDDQFRAADVDFVASCQKGTDTFVIAYRFEAVFIEGAFSGQILREFDAESLSVKSIYIISDVTTSSDEHLILNQFHDLAYLGGGNYAGSGSLSFNSDNFLFGVMIRVSKNVHDIELFQFEYRQDSESTRVDSAQDGIAYFSWAQDGESVCCPEVDINIPRLGIGRWKIGLNAQNLGSILNDGEGVVDMHSILAFESGSVRVYWSALPSFVNPVDSIVKHFAPYVSHLNIEGSLVKPNLVLNLSGNKASLEFDAVEEFNYRLLWQVSLDGESFTIDSITNYSGRVIRELDLTEFPSSNAFFSVVAEKPSNH